MEKKQFISSLLARSSWELMLLYIYPVSAYSELYVLVHFTFTTTL